jgi:hypothetical protein
MYSSPTSAGVLLRVVDDNSVGEYDQLQLMPPTAAGSYLCYVRHACFQKSILLSTCLADYGGGHTQKGGREGAL